MWLVVGTGAIGGALAARLAAAGEPVTVTARPEQLEVIARTGIRLTDFDGRRLVARPAVWELPRPGRRQRGDVAPAGNAERPPAFELVILCVKAYATGEIAGRLRAALGPDVPVLSVQNGLGNEDVLACSFTRVAGGAVTFSARRTAPGAIQVYNRGGAALPTAMGDGSGALPALDRLARALERTGLPVTRPGTSQDIKWSKLLLNLMGNAGAALTRLPPGRLYADPGGFAVERALMREALAVMGAHRRRPVALPGMPVPLIGWLVARAPRRIAQPLLAARVGGGRGHKKPSLLADLEAGADRSEAPWLYGAVARLARQAGMEAPVNEGLARLLEQAYRADPAVASLEGRPDLLAQAVLPSTGRPRRHRRGLAGR